MDVDINGKRKLIFLADEGYQAIVMELLGKQEITGHNFNILIKGLLVDAWTKGEGKHGTAQHDPNKRKNKK